MMHNSLRFSSLDFESLRQIVFTGLHEAHKWPSGILRS